MNHILKNIHNDTHILKYFSSFITVSNGKVVHITEPSLSYCPLASHLHADFKKIKAAGSRTIKQAIRKTIESKIKKYGFFTDNRKFTCNDICVPYGASEMMMFALRKRKISAAVVVCDGAGTVIVNKPEIVQGIGARMNSLVFTSPIKETIEKLKQLKCRIVSDDAWIDQVQGVREAAEKRYKTIAVTINGHSSDCLKEIRKIESKYGISVTILVVCTTGVDEHNVSLIRRYADIVWSCASMEIRKKIGSRAILQLSKQIPVFILTKKGIDFVSAYTKNSKFIKNLDIKKQYLVSGDKGIKRINIGNFSVFISEAYLPVAGGRIPA